MINYTNMKEQVKNGDKKNILIQIDELTKSIYNFGEHFNVLKTKLNSILTNPINCGDDKEQNTPVPVENIAPLAYSIKDNVNKINELIFELKDILDRIDL